MLSKLFNQLTKSLDSYSPTRTQEKAGFIENRILNLQNMDLTSNETANKIDNYMNYSAQGVFNAMAFNKSLPSETKTKIVDHIIKQSFIYDLRNEDMYYSNLRHNGIKAFFNEEHQPKVAIICVGNNAKDAKILPFVDREELHTLMKKSALEDCFDQFKSRQMDPIQLVGNIVKLSNSKDEAFKTILQGVEYNIEPIKDALTKEFDLSTQLDKALRSDHKVDKLEYAILNHLDSENSLDSYQSSRLNKNSILPDIAKRKLMLALDQIKINHQQNSPVQEKFNTQEPVNFNTHEPDQHNGVENIMQSKSGNISISSLAKEHETLFRKVLIGDTHYWENTEKTVKIHPEKISVPKVSRDSVELALSAAVSSFGSELKIRGTKEFDNHVLNILATNEKYKDVTLSNPKLQEQLDALRNTPKNEIMPGTENTIESANQTNKYVLINEQNKELFPINDHSNILDYFKNNFPETAPIIDKAISDGKLEISGNKGGVIHFSDLEKDNSLVLNQHLTDLLAQHTNDKVQISCLNYESEQDKNNVNEYVQPKENQNTLTEQAENLDQQRHMESRR